MHESIALWIERMDAEHGPFQSILEIGSLNVNGSIREHFTTTLPTEVWGQVGRPFYWGIDVAPGNDVDEVADGADYKGNAGHWDCVVTTGALEHTPRAKEIVLNSYRNLKPGGVFICTCAGTDFIPHGVHGDPSPADGEHYENITGQQMIDWLAEAGYAEFAVLDHVDLLAWAKKGTQ